jgi:hypothetical protein
MEHLHGIVCRYPMSTNIDSHEVIAGDGLTLTGRQIVSLLATLEGDLPGDHLLSDFSDEEVEMDKVYEVKPTWRSTWSGNSYDTLLKKVLPETQGSADIVYTWEGGDFFTGVRVVNGVVTQHEVCMALGDELKE